MNRLFKFATLFATVVSLSLLANDVSANGKVTQKQGTTNISSKLQKQQGTGQGVGSPTAADPAEPRLPRPGGGLESPRWPFQSTDEADLPLPRPARGLEGLRWTVW